MFTNTTRDMESDHEDQSNSRLFSIFLNIFVLIKNKSVQVNVDAIMYLKNIAYNMPVF